jgi:hypothetical protein
MNEITTTHNKLSMRVSNHGFSFCVFDVMSNEIIFYNQIHFEPTQLITTTESLYQKAFKENPVLQEAYHEVTIIHNNNLSTVVPNEFFDANKIPELLQYNIKVFNTDSFDNDKIENTDMHLVYVPYANINNFLIDQFKSFKSVHSHSIWINQCLKLATSNYEKTMWVHLDDHHFEIVVTENDGLLLFNTFEYQTKEDFAYYILFTAEQLSMNPNDFKLYLFGNINSASAYYEMIYQFVRNVLIADDTMLQIKNDFPESENCQNFILFNS